MFHMLLLYRTYFFHMFKSTQLSKAIVTKLIKLAVLAGHFQILMSELSQLKVTKSLQVLTAEVVFNWVELNWVELSRAELISADNGLDELGWAELSWAELSWVVLSDV